MNANSKWSAALLLLSGAVYGQQPPDPNPSSDGFGNSAYGTGALSSLTPGSYTGNDNSAFGYEALYNNTTGYGNTATGTAALYRNTTGSSNTATGQDALAVNLTGGSNTATGFGALNHNTIGNNNTATGVGALGGNSSGIENTAAGGGALGTNTTGSSNTASGYQTLSSNTTGNYNSAFGAGALMGEGPAAVATGSSNTALGSNALYSYSTGYNNTAAGANSLLSNTSGLNNTAIGGSALYSNKTGIANVALGANSGYNITGSNNVDIAVRGNAGENGVIRIGTPGDQVSTYISGIENSKVTGAAVYVTASGQLGVLASSERYKTAITPMGSATGKVLRLKPVTFHLKNEPDGVLQYGLIAEEVAKVYPELVVRDRNGCIDGVRYDELAPILLNEVQRQAAEIRQLKQQQRRFATQAELKDLKRQVQAALAELQAKYRLVAQR